MTGRSIANVGSLASKEFPILPFLAPRVFAQFSGGHQPGTWTASGPKILEEGRRRQKKQSSVDNLTARCSSIPPGTLCSPQNSARISSKPLRHSASRPRVIPQSSDVSSFVRETFRCYSAPVLHIGIERTTFSDLTGVSGNQESESTEPVRTADSQHMPLSPDLPGEKVIWEEGMYNCRTRRNRRYKLLLRRNSRQRGRPYNIHHPKDLSERLRAQDPSWQWIATTAPLFAPYDRRISRDVWIPELKPSRDCLDLILSIVRTETVEEMKERWMAQDLDFQRIFWPSLLSWLLAYSPATAFSFIEAMANDMAPPYPPPYAISDGLEYLCLLKQHGRDSKENPLPADLGLRCIKLLEKRPDVVKCSSQSFIHGLFSVSGPEGRNDLYAQLPKWGFELGYTTLLHFAGFFGGRGDYRLALAILEQAAKKGSVEQSGFMATCSVILQGSMLREGGYHASSEIVERFLTLGVRMNIYLYNILMHNAVKAGDLNTAFRIYRLLEENGVTPTSHTYSILLRACGASQVYDDVAKQCAAKALELKSPWSATVYLYYLYESLQRQGWNRLLPTLAEAYRTFFDPAPLIQMGILHPSYALAPGASAPLETSSPALNIMITARIRSLGKDDGNVLLDIYGRFRAMVEEGHPDIAPLAEDDFTYNAFLMAFSMQPHWLNHCPAILKDMTAELPPTAIHRKERRPITPCQPTTKTWNILLRNFNRWKQTEAARKVLGLMKKRNIKPDLVTWNTLIYGYAKQQDTRGVIEMIRNIEDQRLEMDQHTLSALSHLNDREMLAKALASPDPQPRVQAESDAVRHGERNSNLPRKHGNR